VSESLRVDCPACGSSFVLDETTLVKRDWPDNPVGWLVGIVCPVCGAFTLSYRMTPELEVLREKVAGMRAAHHKRRRIQSWNLYQQAAERYQVEFNAVQGRG